MNVRDAEAAEIDQLARIWYDAWQDAHAQILPAELTRIRTLESFRDRLQAALPNTRVVGAPGEPVGFCIVAGDELYQLTRRRRAVRAPRSRWWRMQRPG